MIDIETLGLAPDCCIISIGAIRFSMWPEPFEVTDKLELNITLPSNLANRRRIDQSTADWWMTTDPSLFVKTLTKGDTTLCDALDRLSDFITGPNRTKPEDDCEIWANGTDFDVTILTHAYKTVLKKSPPWKYNMVRDCRTIYKVFGGMERPKGSVEHDAVEDCIFQAMSLAETVRKIKSEAVNTKSVEIAVKP